MNFTEIAEITAELTSLKFFPTDDAGRIGIMKIIGSMATEPDQVRWLVKRMLELFDEWPGPRTMRMVFCKRFKPRDGIDLRTGICERYPEGIPNEKPEAVPRLTLPSGHVASADPELEAMVDTAVQLSRKMPPAVPLPRDAEFRRRLEEVLTAPSEREAVIPELAEPKSVPPVADNGQFAGQQPEPFKRITQADIDAALAELHARKRP